MRKRRATHARLATSTGCTRGGGGQTFPCVADRASAGKEASRQVPRFGREADGGQHRAGADDVLRRRDVAGALPGAQGHSRSGGPARVLGGGGPGDKSGARSDGGAGRAYGAAWVVPIVGGGQAAGLCAGGGVDEHPSQGRGDKRRAYARMVVREYLRYDPRRCTIARRWGGRRLIGGRLTNEW